MRAQITAWLLIATLTGPLHAAPPQRPPPRRDRTVALLAGAALHLAQNARALQSASLKRREKEYGPNDPQVKAGHRNLRVIHQKLRYFRHVKRHSEGSRPLTHRRHVPHEGTN